LFYVRAKPNDINRKIRLISSNGFKNMLILFNTSSSRLNASVKMMM